MGTRSTTKIYRKFKGYEELVLSLYKQYDGFVENWGKDIKDFFKEGKVCSGIPFDDSDTLYFNGVGDFALLLVKEFKTESGDLYATDSEDIQEYNYKIVFDEDSNKVIFSVEENANYYEEFEMIEEVD